MKTGSKTEPWYAAGLRFSCRRCGACCTGEPGYVFLGGGASAAMARHLGVGEREFKRTFTRKVGGRRSLVEKEDGRCVFFLPEGCRIYRVRPRQCRCFPFWAWNMRSENHWREAARDCPGMGKGRRFSREEIEKLR